MRGRVAGCGEPARCKMGSREIPERHRRPDRRAGPEILAAADIDRVVADSVEPNDHAVVLAQYPRMSVGDEPAAGTDVAGIDLDRVEGWFSDSAECGIWLCAGVAEVVLVDCVAALEIVVVAGRDELVEPLHRAN